MILIMRTIKMTRISRTSPTTTLLTTVPRRLPLTAINQHWQGLIRWSDFTSFSVDAATQTDNAQVLRGSQCATDTEYRSVRYRVMCLYAAPSHSLGGI
jgi:hypothetical protein